MFHRAPAEVAILRTEITEGIAGGPGCANTCRSCSLYSWAGSSFIGCSHLDEEVPNEKGVSQPPAKGASGQKSKRAVRQKRKNTESSKEKQVRYFLSGYTLWQPTATFLKMNKSKY